MRAVVLEKRDGYAAVLLDDGTVMKIKRACEVGDVLDVTKKDAVNAGKVLSFGGMRRKTAAAAAVLLLATVGTGGYYTTATAASYVTVEGDSSIELSLNRFGRVIKVEAVDGEAKEVVDALYAEGIRNDTLQTALEKAAQTMKEKGYMEERNAPVIDIHADSEGTYEKLSTQVGNMGFDIKGHENGGGKEPVKAENIPEGSVPEGNVPEENIPKGSIPEGNISNENIPEGSKTENFSKDLPEGDKGTVKPGGNGTEPKTTESEPDGMLPGHDVPEKPENNLENNPENGAIPSGAGNAGQKGEMPESGILNGAESLAPQNEHLAQPGENGMGEGSLHPGADAMQGGSTLPIS